MFRAVVYHWLRFARYFFWASVLVVMNACVTTTTGGFNVEPSDEEALENYLQLAEAYNISALISQPEGDLELAIENFQRAVRLDQGNARARNNYAALLFSKEDYENAFDELLTVTQDAMYEGRTVSFENLGRSAMSLNRLEEAAVAFTHTPRALLADITIESRFNNQKLVDDFTRMLTTFYQDSPEYAELQQRMTDAN